MKSLRPLLLTTVLAFAALPVQAAPFTYEPEQCEFKITFPEKPYIEQKCTSGDKKVCTEVVSFTKVVSADTSVNFRITCNEHNKADLAKYTPEVMKKAINTMITDASLTVDDVKTSEKNGYKSAAAVSVGTRGDRDIIYTGQIWIGKTSLFSLEGDMTGPQDAKADQIFSDVLKSMRPKNVPEKAPAKSETKKP